MAETVQNLNVKVNVDDKDKSKISGINNELAKTGDVAEKSTKSALDAYDKLSIGLSNLSGTAQMVGEALKTVSDTGIAVGKSLIESAAQMEVFRTSLKTAFQGDNEGAEKLLSTLKEMANTTPFVTSEVIDAGIKLKAYGNEAEKIPDLLKNIGNMASGMGKSLDQAVEAYADASTGELERFKEFGITKAMIDKQVNGALSETKDKSEQVALIMQGLNEIMTERFAGGMEAASKTLTGEISTLKGEFEDLKSQLGEELLPTAKAVTENLTEFVRTIKELDPEIKKTALAIGGLVTGVALIGGAVAGVVAVGASVLASVVSITGAIASSTIAMTGLNITLGVLTVTFSSFASAIGVALAVLTSFPAVVTGLGIAVGVVAYKTLEWQKATAELKIKDLAEDTKRYADALNEVKSFMPDINNATQAFNELKKQGIDNLLKEEEGQKKVHAVLVLLAETQLDLTDRRAEELKVLQQLQDSGARPEEIKQQQLIIDKIDESIAGTLSYKEEINNATSAAQENKNAVTGITSELSSATDQAKKLKDALSGELPQIISPEEKEAHEAFVEKTKAEVEESNKIYEEGLKERSEKTKQVVKETGDFEKAIQRDTLLSTEEVYRKQFDIWYEYENQKINLKQKLIELDKLENGNITSLAEEKAYLEDIYSLQENMVSELSKQGEVYRLKLNSGQSLSKIEQEILGQYIEEKKTLEEIGLQIENNRSKRMQEYEDNLKILDTVNEILVREGKITQEEADREAAGYKQRMIDSNKENIAQIIEMVKAGEQLTEWQKELLNLYNQEEADVKNINTALNEKLGIVTQVTSETSKAVQEQEKYNSSVKQGNEEAKKLVETIGNITAAKGGGTPSGLGEFSSTPGGSGADSSFIQQNLRSNAGLYGGIDYTAKYNENRENQLSQQASNNIMGQNYIANRVADVGTTFVSDSAGQQYIGNTTSNNTNNAGDTIININGSGANSNAQVENSMNNFLSSIDSTFGQNYS